MPNTIEIDGYEEALKSESRDRANAFLDLPETIACIPCKHMTLLLMEWLISLGSPFIVGGKVTPAAILQFLWIVNEQFCKDKTSRDIFIAANLDLDIEEATRGIDDYLERTFLDSPDGKSSCVPYYSPAASILYSMQDAPFRWSFSQTMSSPLRVIYQLLKAHSKASGAIVVNKRSDKVSGDWLDKLNEQLAKENKSVETFEI